jgi:hypothetical protein
MVTTKKSIAQHIIRDVFDFAADSPLEMALTEAAFMDVASWFTVSDDELKGLTYIDNKVHRPLKLGHFHKLRLYRTYVYHQHGKDASYDGTDVTKDEFEKFSSSNECIRLMTLSQPYQTVPANPNAVMSSTQTELATFRKGIKRDASLFPVMNQDSQWDSWNRSIVSIARAQAVEQVLDSTYVPVLLEEIALFNEKQKYLYSVFERTLQSDKGKAIVRSHEDKFDAQKVYKEMYDYCNSSTRAQLESSTLLSYITSIHLGDGSWKSGMHKSYSIGRNKCGSMRNWFHPMTISPKLLSYIVRSRVESVGLGSVVDPF